MNDKTPDSQYLLLVDFQNFMSQVINKSKIGKKLSLVKNAYYLLGNQRSCQTKTGINRGATFYTIVLLFSPFVKKKNHGGFFYLLVVETRKHGKHRQKLNQ